MSKAQVGTIYQAIIEDVINVSRGDFEDQGIEERVLEDLRKVCLVAALANPHAFIFACLPSTVF